MMNDTKLGLTAESAARIVTQALEQWGQGTGLSVIVAPEPNGDVRVSLGAQWFVVGVKAVEDKREYRLLFDPEE